MKITYIVGNRPQFVKLAVLHSEAKKRGIEESVIHTGQHFADEMSSIFFRELTIGLDVVNLNIHSFSHATMIGKMMKELEPELTKLRPDYVIVFGDTNTTLAGALTAKKMGLTVAHIEAGIRTHDESMPEESNRYLTDRLSAYNFCCTHDNVKNLEREGFDGKNIASKVIYSGDVMLDAYRMFADTDNASSEIHINYNQYILFTVHRRQNLEDISVLKSIITALNELSEEMQVVSPMHPNTAKLIKENGMEVRFDIIPPVGYMHMQKLLKNATYVITDSGGLQREAFFAGKPSLIIMEKPFWPEVIKHGCSLNCRGNSDEIIASFRKLKTSKKIFDPSVFGNGNAAGIILQQLADDLKKSG